MSLVTEEIRAKAEIYVGNEICREKSRFFLKESGLPNGLLPLRDIEECGYVKETGFVWLKQKKSITHKFEKVGRVGTYATEVTATVEPNKITKLTGVKTKELLIWLSLYGISVDQPTGKITIKATSGLSRSFPVAAFQIEEEEKIDNGTQGAIPQVNGTAFVNEEKKVDNGKNIAAVNGTAQLKEINMAVQVKEV